MQPGIWQILIIAVVALLLFGGRGKISGLNAKLRELAGDRDKVENKVAAKAS